MTKQNHIDIVLDEDAENVVTAVIDEDKPVVLSGNDPDIIDEDINPLDKLPDHAVPNDDGSVTLMLAYPKTLATRKDGKVKEREFRELTFHRLNGADQRAIAAASDDMQSVVAFARSTRINQAVMNALFDRMDAADISDGGRVLNHFLTSGSKAQKRPR